MEDGGDDGGESAVPDAHRRIDRLSWRLPATDDAGVTNVRNWRWVENDRIPSCAIGYLNCHLDELIPTYRLDLERLTREWMADRDAERQPVAEEVVDDLVFKFYY